MLNRSLCVLAVGLWLAGPAQAAIIVVGDHQIAPNAVTPIEIVIEPEAGDPEIAAVDFAMQIGDGITGPTIGQVDLETGTPFDGHNVGGSSDKGSLPRQAFWEIITDVGTVPVPSSGILATVEIDTTGITGGTYAVKLTSVSGISTEILDGLNSPVSLNQGQEITGSVTIIPEPVSLFTWGMVVMPLALRRRVGCRCGVMG